VRPAVALSIAIAAKLTPVLLLGYFAWRRRFGLCAATLAALVVIAILPAVVIGFPMNTHLLEGFASYAVQKIDEGDNYALRGWLLSTGLSPQTVTRIWVAAVLAGTLAVLVALRPVPRTPAAHFAEFCIVLIAMLLASPHTQRRYFIALYVPILFLLARLRTGPIRRRRLITSRSRRHRRGRDDPAAPAAGPEVRAGMKPTAPLLRTLVMWAA
jgi:hypothetical protein